MPLFFWIVIGVAGIMLAALVVILLAELGSQRRKKRPGRGAAPTAKAREKVSAEPAEAATETAVVQEAVPSVPAAPAVEVPEAAEGPETEGMAGPAEGEGVPEAVEIPGTAGVSEAEEPAAEAPSEAGVEGPAEAAAAPTPYPEFSNARAVEELGLTQEEADLFIGELVTQIEAELPALEAAVAANDAKKLEEVSHLLKGSSTSLGTGGVSDVFTALNAVCKTDDFRDARRHLEDLRFYLEQLKTQFGI